MNLQVENFLKSKIYCTTSYPIIYYCETHIKKSTTWWKVSQKVLSVTIHRCAQIDIDDLSGEFWARQAKLDLVKIQKFHFSCWAWSTPWGHVVSLKTFHQIPVLSWAIRYSVFQKVKFTSSLQKWAGNVNFNFRHQVVKFGHNEWF